LLDIVIRPGTDNESCPRLGCLSKLRPLDLLQQEGEGAVDDRAGITVGDLAAQQRLETPRFSWLAAPMVN